MAWSAGYGYGAAHDSDILLDQCQSQAGAVGGPVTVAMLIEGFKNVFDVFRVDTDAGIPYLNDKVAGIWSVVQICIGLKFNMAGVRVLDGIAQ